MSMSREDSAREPENPEVRGRDGIANQSGPIGFFPESTTSSTSYLSPIIRARPQVTAEITPLAIPYPLQFPANFFVTHGISSSSSSSYRRSCSSREFTFRPFFLHIRNYPKVCPVLLDLLNAGDSFAGISPLTSCYLFSSTRDLIAMF
jgi:hypothetical protein